MSFHLEGNYAPVATECIAKDLPVEGRIPESLNGFYVRNGPNPRPGTASGHWFFGDGMLHAIELREGAALSYRNRWVRTSTFVDNAAMLKPDFTVDRSAGVANTNVISHAGRMLALVETSFPYEVTPELDTIGAYDFNGRLTSAMTAHPKVCPTTGEMHFFGYGFAPPYVTYHCVDAHGELVHSRVIDVPAATMMHDFAITATHVVFLDLPVVFDVDRALSGTMPYRWDDDYGARLGLLRRDTVDATVTWHDIEPCYVFHVMNAFDDGDRVVIDAARYPELWRRDADHFDTTTMHRWTINTLDGRVHETTLDDMTTEFPRVDERRTGLPYRYGYAIHNDGDTSGSIVRYDLDAHATDTIALGPGRIPSEAVFVPASVRAAEDDGHLLAFVYDATHDASELVILDAADPHALPVATVHLPQRVPFGFHGNWMSV